MGLIKKAKSKITSEAQQAPGKLWNKVWTEPKARKKEENEVRRRGYLKGLEKRGEREGQGLPQKGGRKTGWLPAIEGSLNNAERTFGFRGTGVSLDPYETPRKTQPAMRRTVISKGGKVTIYEPMEGKKKKTRQSESFFEDIDDNLFG
jgi:hypothetical protein